MKHAAGCWLKLALTLVTTTVAGCGDSIPAQLDAAPDAGSVDAPPALLNARDVLPPSAACEFGAERLSSGLDDGGQDATANDGVLSLAEIDTTTTTCLSAPEPSLIRPSGLATAPVNQTCRPPTGDSASAGVRLAPAFANVVFPATSDCLPGINTTSCQGAFRPVALRQQPGTQRMYVAEQPGRIVMIENNVASVALDIRSKVVFGYEPGLLNIEFDPANGGFLYVSYITCGAQATAIIPAALGTCIDGLAGESYATVSRFTVAANGIVDATSERLILEQIKPSAEHNGGGALFGPDGNLFIAFGDGGEYPSDTAQQPTTLLGKILRVSVNTAPGVPLSTIGPAYVVPTDNPFVAVNGYRAEIYALGFRNPWRYSFDPLSTTMPRLWVGDVGLITAEEVNYVEPGKNYGWPILEATYCHFRGADVGRFSVSTDTTCNALGTYAAPAHWYRQARGVAVTGGAVYRGTAIPRLRGNYLFADFSLGHIWMLTGSENKTSFIAASGMLISSFGEDLNHEMYVMDWWTGEIRKLVPTGTTPARPATNLSATGCVSSTAPASPAEGAIPYSVNVGFFSEAAVYKQRYLFLPVAGGGITEYDNTGSLILQPGSVFMKTFDVAGKHVETRLMYFQADAQWTFWSYKWLSDQSDATLVDQAEDIAPSGVAWHLPNQGECIHCHTAATGGVLGFRIEQLNRLAYYPSTQTWANQVDTLRQLNLIDRVEPIDRAFPISAQNARIVPMPASGLLPKLPRSNDSTVPIVDRVGAYLETNCSYCHRPAGGGRGEFSLERSRFLSGLCNQTPQSAAFDDPTMKLIKPGDPARSAVLRRMMETTLPYQMHPYRMSVDTAGVALINEWITTTAAADCASVQ